MKKLVVLTIGVIAFAATGEEIRDVDVEEIMRVVSEIDASPVVQISEASDACAYTAEAACTAELRVFFDSKKGANYLTVSKVDGNWIIGKWQREIIDFRSCRRELTKDGQAAIAIGEPIPKKELRARLRACFGPDGRVGGTRSKSSNNALQRTEDK